MKKIISIIDGKYFEYVFKGLITFLLGFILYTTKDIIFITKYDYPNFKQRTEQKFEDMKLFVIDYNAKQDTIIFYKIQNINNRVNYINEKLINIDKNIEYITQKIDNILLLSKKNIVGYNN